MGVGFLHCLLVLTFLFCNSGSLSAQAIKQNMKNKHHNLFTPSRSSRILMHDIYPTTTTTTTMHDHDFPTSALVHDAYPTDVPVGPMDVPSVDPTPTTGPPSIPTTTPMTGPPTNPTPSVGGGGGGGGGGGWCVVNPSASEKALQVALDYACGYGGADCSQIQPGASCYNPNTVRDHASFAFNDYYQKNPAPTSCVFGGTAQLVNTDPSNGSCHYPSSGGTTSTPPATSTPTVQAPPDLMSPPSPVFPGPLGGAGTGSGFGAEPIGSPNMATFKTQPFFLIFSSISILMYILMENHL